ncbi:MAG: galactonate dehydratase [Opitutales bacterium]|nr:galactonate dehydratase [Opitutales bacterium]
MTVNQTGLDESVRITGFETFHVKPRWLFLKVSTNAGICGWGEPVLEGRARTVETAVHEIGRSLKGRNPFEIEALWQEMYRGSFYRGGPILTSAISGIEQALWDIKGKALGVPVYELLGGAVRKKVRLYAWMPGASVGDYVEQAVETRSKGGFTAFKLVPLPALRAIESPAAIDRIVQNVARVREELGWETDLCLDFHGRARLGVARTLIRELEALKPTFIEEPVLPENLEALRQLRASTSIPLACGERLFTRWAFRDLIREHLVDLIQPDLSHVGGIFEARKLAAMAETEEICLAPHCPLGPIALAACLQLAACTPNFFCQEHMTLGEGLLKQPFIAQEGHVEIGPKPGLGIELDEDAVRSQAFDGTWEIPRLSLEDGSFAEW